MSPLIAAKLAFFVIRRAFVRVIGVFTYAVVVERAGWDGLDDLIWNEGHFWPFVLIGMACSVLIDLVIETTKPNYQITHKSNDSCDPDKS